MKWIDLEEDGVLLARLAVELFPRPGEHIHLTFEPSTRGELPREVAVEVVRISFASAVNKDKVAVSTRLIAHVRAVTA